MALVLNHLVGAGFQYIKLLEALLCKPAGSLTQAVDRGFKLPVSDLTRDSVSIVQ